MDWVLVVLVLWSGQLTSMQIPIGTKELCVEARKLAVFELQISQSKTGAPPIEAEVTATCLQVR